MSNPTEEENVVQDLKTSRRLTRLGDAPGGAFSTQTMVKNYMGWSIISLSMDCTIVAWDERRAIFTGGFRGDGASDSCFVYNKETLQMETLPPMRYARCGHAAVILGGMLFVIGGRGPNGSGPRSPGGITLDSIEVLDLNDPQQWEQCPVKLEFARCYCSAVAVNEQDIYIIGGNGGMIGNLDSVEILNTVTQTMSLGPSMSQRRCMFAAALIGDSIVIAGGSENRATGTTSDCEQLSIRAGSDEDAHYQWRPLNAMTTEREGHHGVSFGNCMVVVGGTDRAEGELTTMEVWNSSTGMWMLLPDTLVDKGPVRGFVKLGDDLVCFTGRKTPSIHCLFSASGLLKHQRRQIRFNELIADDRVEIVIPLLLKGLHQRGWTSLIFECIRETNGRLIHRRERPAFGNGTVAGTLTE